MKHDLVIQKRLLRLLPAVFAICVNCSLLHAQDGNLFTTFAGKGDPMAKVQPSVGITYYIGMQGSVAGHIKAYAASRALDPFNGSVWHPCDGSLFSITQWQSLFFVLGNRFGGDGRTTFAIPDLRGRVPVGVTSSTELGTQWGGEEVSLQEVHVPKHTHSVQQGVVMKTTPNAGQSFDNRQPSLGLRYIIRIQGTSEQLGEIRLFAGGNIPNGWIPAAGQQLPIADFLELYTQIGSTWGGDRFNFRLPDFRGRALFGEGLGAGLTTSFNLGQLVGSNQQFLPLSFLPPHTHEADGETTGSTGSGGNSQLSNWQSTAAVTFAIPRFGPTFANDDTPVVGEIVPFAKSGGPGRLSSFWLEATGGVIPIAENRDLFFVLGTIWGGDGRVNMGVPDLRGRVAVNRGQGPGLPNRRVADKWGSERKTFTPDNMPRHRHIIEIDSEEPVGIITSTALDPTATQSIPVAVTFNEPVIGFERSDLVTSPGSISNFTVGLEGKVYTFNFTPTTDGTKTITFGAGVCKDEAQNDNLAPAPFAIVFDTTPPRGILSGPSSPVETLVFSITIDFGEQVEDFTGSDLGIINGSLQGGLLDQGNGCFRASVRANSDGNVVIRLAANRLQDLAGNSNLASGDLIVLVDRPTPYENWAKSFGLDSSNDGIGKDPDSDGKTNLEEFAFGCHPLVREPAIKSFTSFEVDGAISYLTLTFPVRSGSVFSSNSNNQQTASRDGVVYLIQGASNPGDSFTLPTASRTTIDTSGFPVLPTGYIYRSFRLTKATTDQQKAFMRVGVGTP